VTPRARRARVKRVAEPPAPALASRRLLLDTHTWLWWQADDRHLGARTRAAIQSAAEVRFSAASAWEIAIKSSLGKLTLPRNASIEAELERDGFEPLAVEVAHAEALRGLPPLHRDPFGRMLVAQAKTEGLTLVTGDDQMEQYGIPVLIAVE
jgi:PIN domain nuclease of toxin-antitoxin system